jgi:hypothetical protein
MKYPVKSIKHIADKRARIPSGEEAGYEAGSKQVKESSDSTSSFGLYG